MCRNTKFGTFLTSGRHTECACYVLKPLLVLFFVLNQHDPNPLERFVIRKLIQPFRNGLAVFGKDRVNIHVVFEQHLHGLDVAMSGSTIEHGMSARVG